jgi:hypothetical protein
MASEFGYHARLIGTVAQLVEQGPFKALVLGSSPSRPTNKNSELRDFFRSLPDSRGNHATLAAPRRGPVMSRAAIDSARSPRGATARQYHRLNVPKPRSAQQIADSLPPSSPERLRAAEDGPCPGCRHFDRCAAEVICREAFVLYARLDDHRGAGRWMQASRQPNSVILEPLLIGR